ncbi:helix-turn-helix transcriptional regulator [Chitinophaga varians]|uniref:Helix-turn-helix transcriptional regulator n=1 Tax=Chitinophaga varians TaxID=2202339 RepID=A0A847RZ23_9BACT|nr:helix-turn-helix domain-containing protein [Chitinophaga varians]NLR67244.1 helix-turn-helix transcriptional regulator [Chitinophaga varians]
MASKVKGSSTNAHNLKALASYCDVNETLLNISQRWKVQILHSIFTGLQHFSQLKKAHPSLSDQVLGKRLGELVAQGLVNKTCITTTTPVQTEYSITCKGKGLLTVIFELQTWSKKDWAAQQLQCSSL